MSSRGLRLAALKRRMLPSCPPATNFVGSSILTTSRPPEKMEHGVRKDDDDMLNKPEFAAK